MDYYQKNREASYAVPHINQSIYFGLREIGKRMNGVPEIQPSNKF
jgi:hypothetical protein